MSDITPTTTTTSATNSTSGSTSSTSATPNVNENEFLQLMIAELQNQDPMSASSTDPTEYVTQLAQFTALEQQTNTAQSTAQSANEQETSGALAMLGQTVSYTDSNGNTYTGAVQQVDLTSSGPTLTVDGTSGIPYSSVTEVS